MSVHKELVSVIITTQNRQVLLARALDSVINQTYKNLEIIVVDDCSNDDTADVVKEFQQRDSRIIYIKNEKILGSNASRNRGISAAKGKFIAGLDDDDEFLPQRIELLLQNYDEKFSFITSNNALIFDTASYFTNMPGVISLEQMLRENVVMNQGLIERERILDVGLYDESLSACQDYDLWMRLILSFGSVKTISTVTQKVYMEESRTRISSCSHRKFSGYFQFYKKYKYLMTREDTKTHFHRIYDIRNKMMSPFVALILSSPHDVRKKFDSFILSKALEQKGRVGYQFLVDTLLKIETIGSNDTVIVYGYGTVGRLLHKIMGEKIVAVIDQALRVNGTKKVGNIDVISMDEIRKFQNCPIIITPYVQKEMIIKNLKERGGVSMGI